MDSRFRGNDDPSNRTFSGPLVISVWAPRQQEPTMQSVDSATTPHDTGTASPARASLLAFALIVGLFFLWGVANNLNDILIKQFKNAFTLSDFQAGLVQSAFYLGYFLLAIPAGVCMRRFGFKSAILIGLALYALGALLF